MFVSKFKMASFGNKKRGVLANLERGQLSYSLKEVLYSLFHNKLIDIFNGLERVKNMEYSKPSLFYGKKTLVQKKVNSSSSLSVSLCHMFF